MNSSRLVIYHAEKGACHSSADARNGLDDIARQVRQDVKAELMAKCMGSGSCTSIQMDCEISSRVMQLAKLVKQLPGQQ